MVKNHSSPFPLPNIMAPRTIREIRHRNMEFDKLKSGMRMSRRGEAVLQILLVNTGGVP